MTTLATRDVLSLFRTATGEFAARVDGIGDRWTVSSRHAELRWDGTRWATHNVSTRAGLLQVYEPGYEEVPLEPQSGPG